MLSEYVHQELGQEVHALAGFYVPLKELRVKHDGREVLCVIGMSKVESSCCGAGSCGYAIVPGYLVAWQNRRNKAGLPVSEVEPIANEMTKREIARKIREIENIANIDFW